MNIILNKLKLNKKFKVNSRLNTHDFESHFSALAKDNESLSEEHMRIQSVVTERSLFLTSKKVLPFSCTECDIVECLECKGQCEITSNHGCKHSKSLSFYTNNITCNTILNAIRSLKKGTSPGIDNITPEHLIYALSSTLGELLANVYSIMISL